ASSSRAMIAGSPSITATSGALVSAGNMPTPPQKSCSAAELKRCSVARQGVVGRDAAARSFAGWFGTVGTEAYRQREYTLSEAAVSLLRQRRQSSRAGSWTDVAPVTLEASGHANSCYPRAPQPAVSRVAACQRGAAL